MSVNGYVISGNLAPELIKKSLPSKMNVVGRLDMSTAEKVLKFTY